MMNNIPRPEHPRPQFFRPSRQNINGTLDFLFDFDNSGLNHPTPEVRVC